MNGDLDTLLSAFRDDAPTTLSGVEDGMWREIHRRRRARQLFLGEVGRTTGIAAVALLIGVAVSIARPAAQPKPVNITLLLTEVPPASLLE
jgi:type VI protein secretion system component VasF